MSFYYKLLKKYRRKKDHIAQKVRETLLQIDNLNETVFRDSITVENNPSMSGGKTVLFLGTGALDSFRGTELSDHNAIFAICALP
jgi:hypothetical protein